jgi:ABC-2 type transport system ATP-binding protein
MPVITVENLRKEYRVPEREAGMAATLGSLVRRQFKTVHAVAGVSFTVEAGEIVGFLGPNGAGKTTTLKMLSGLLHPTGGTAQVLGCLPWRRENAYLRRISMVMGQRSQLMWDIPAVDSFLVNKAIYHIPDPDYRETLDQLVDLLDLGALLKKPVRNLSLGERMKCELAASLLHRPQVMFLDEPTIGVDVTMQARIRQFVGEHNRRTGATILLTSHYMADVVALCRRVVIIHHGRILFDGELAGLADRLAPFKTLELTLERDLDGADLSGFGEVVRREARKLVLRVPKAETPAVTARLLQQLPVADLTVEDPPIEEVIDRIFRDGLGECGVRNAECGMGETGGDGREVAAQRTGG